MGGVQRLSIQDVATLLRDLVVVGVASLFKLYPTRPKPIPYSKLEIRHDIHAESNALSHPLPPLMPLPDNGPCPYCYKILDNVYHQHIAAECVSAVACVSHETAQVLIPRGSHVRDWALTECELRTLADAILDPTNSFFEELYSHFEAFTVLGFDKDAIVLEDHTCSMTVEKLLEYMRDPQNKDKLRKKGYFVVRCPTLTGRVSPDVHQFWKKGNPSVMTGPFFIQCFVNDEGGKAKVLSRNDYQRAPIGPSLLSATNERMDQAFADLERVFKERLSVAAKDGWSKVRCGGGVALGTLYMRKSNRVIGG
jgi:hypothetical protein